MPKWPHKNKHVYKIDNVVKISALTHFKINIFLYEHICHNTSFGKKHATTRLLSSYISPQCSALLSI